MIKRILIAIALIALMAIQVQGAGFTITGLTEQAIPGGSDRNDNAVTLRLGYFLGVNDEGGGLEPFIGTCFYPKDDYPQVIALGAKQYLPDVLDENSPIPYLPNILLMVITEKAVMRPYFGGDFTINLADRDAGFFEFLGGVDIKLSPEANSSVEFETIYGSMFGDLSGRADYELICRLGFIIPFPKE